MLDDQPVIDLLVEGTPVRLLGTAHVSRVSAEKVSSEIQTGNYITVAIELCESRYKSLKHPETLDQMDLFEVIRKKKTLFVTGMLAIGAFQQKLAEQFKIEPGAEMRAAIEGTAKYDLNLELIDRDIAATIRRIYRNVPFWKRIYLFTGTFASLLVEETITEAEIEALKDRDILENVFSQFANSAEEIYLPLIEERDGYMASQIIRIAKRNAGPILAVVGAGHLKGIAERLKQRKSLSAAEMQDLESVPENKSWFRFLPWIVVAVVVCGFVFGFSQSSELGFRLITDWIVINGGLCSLGVLVAGGHPLTIVSAFLAAPLTSLNPTIGAGMVTGLVEAWVRKPTVEDFRSLRSSTASWKGWRTNRVARTFLVFFCSTIGSAIGTYVAGFRIIEQLF